MTESTIAPVHRFVDALEARDFDALQAAFAPHVVLRALVPTGLREAKGAAAARGLIESWFVDSERYTIVARAHGSVGDREHATYRVEGHEVGADYVAEQELFATVTAHGITHLDLLCSGFRPKIER